MGCREMLRAALAALLAGLWWTAAPQAESRPETGLWRLQSNYQEARRWIASLKAERSTGRCAKNPDRAQVLVSCRDGRLVIVFQLEPRPSAEGALSDLSITLDSRLVSVRAKNRDTKPFYSVIEEAPILLREMKQATTMTVEAPTACGTHMSATFTVSGIAAVEPYLQQDGCSLEPPLPNGTSQPTGR
jgi:hypothetical protein